LVFRKIILCLVLSSFITPPASAGCGDVLKRLFSRTKTNGQIDSAQSHIKSDENSKTADVASGTKVHEAADALPKRTELSRDAEALREFRKLDPETRKQKIYDYAYKVLNPGNWYNRGVVLFNWAAAAVIGTRVVEEIHNSPHPVLMSIPVLLSPIVAHYAADWGSAFYHKRTDSYSSEKDPLTTEFRHHHEFPDNLNHVSYTDNIAGASKALALPFAAMATAAVIGHYDPGSALEALKATGLAFGGTFLLSTAHTNEFHRQAHLKNPNKFFQVMQKLGITLQREDHLAHHKPPFDDEYGVNSGWSNPMAKRLDLWKRLDKLFYKYTGKMPHNWIQDPRSIPPEVVEQLEKDLESIPSDLWDYGETFPARVPPKLEPTLKKAKENWRTVFIETRREIYLEMAKKDPEGAKLAWAEEQKEFKWAYGSEHIPLFEEEPK